MRPILIAILVASALTAATLNVCISGCPYATVQAAAGVSNPGDTIVIQAGYNAGGLTMPGGWHNVTIKSSAIDAYPRGYRMLRGGCRPGDTSVETDNGLTPTWSCKSGAPTVLATIGTSGGPSVQLGDNGLFLTLAGGLRTTTLTNAPGGNPTAHGLSVNDLIVSSAKLYSAFYCGLSYPPPAPWNTGADTSCTVGNTGYINIRTQTMLYNGAILYFLGRTLPTPLQLNTPYYIVNFTQGSTNASAYPGVTDQFQLSLTSGGSPISIPYFDPTGQDFVIEYDPLPVREGTTLYVVSTPTASTLTLSLTMGGSPITWTQIPYGYNGGGFSSGFGAGTVNPVHDITFDGIEVAPTADYGVYYPFFIQGNCGFHSLACENYNINVYRSWIHGADDQLDFPTAAMAVNGNNIDIEDSVIEGAYYTSSDSQGIGFVSTGHVNFANNDIKGATENIFSGGNVPWFGFGYNTTGINVTRNYLWKPLKALIGINGEYLSATTFTLIPRYGSGDCSNAVYGGSSPVSTTGTVSMGSASVTVASGSGISGGMAVSGTGIPIGTIVSGVSGATVTLSGNASAGGSGVTLNFYNSVPYYFQCLGYEARETPNTATPPANPAIAADIWTGTSAASTFTVTSPSNGQVGLLYWLGGAIHMDYNFGGSVSCPMGVTCTYKATPYFPFASARIGIACVGSNTTYDCQSPNSGGFDSGEFYAGFRPPFTKNELESKYGDDWLIEGNVFHRSIDCDSGTVCQGMMAELTNGTGGSGPGDPVNWSISSSNSVIRHNLFRMASIGTSFVGQSFATGLPDNKEAYEWAGFGAGTDNLMQNNFFADVGSTEYGVGNAGQLFETQNNISLTVDHNTGVDFARGLQVNGTSTDLTYSSNVLTPYRWTCYNPSDCSQPAATSEIGAQYNSGINIFPSANASGVTYWTALVSSGLVPRANWLNNLIMNRPGNAYSATVPGQYPACPTTCSYLAPGSSGAVADPTVLFTSWQERDNTQPPNGLPYRNGNYHLASGQAATYPAADSRAIGADVDEVNSFVGGIPANGISGQTNGMTGSDVESGAPQFYQRVARNIAVGSTSAILTYLSDGFPCTIQLWPNTNYSGTPAVSIADTGASVVDGTLVIPLTGLIASTAYQGKRLCGPEADIISFTTLAASPSATYQFAPPAGTSTCVIEYGSTIALGSSTVPVAVAAGTCSVIVPSTTWWRNDYLDAGGNVIAMSDMRRSAQ